MATTTEIDDRQTTGATHQWLGFAPRGRPGGHVAVCSCGWLSARCGSAGLAGAAMDLHQRSREG